MDNKKRALMEISVNKDKHRKLKEKEYNRYNIIKEYMY